jgi:DNA-nicking Smr family endonuclease
MSPRHGDDAKVFEGAMRGIEPIGDSRRRSPGTVKKRASESSAAVGFTITREESRIYGHRDGVAASDLEKLRDGKYTPQNRLDLHGMTRDVARESVRRFVRQANRSGLRCVAIIHGRGLRSPAGAVLKEEVPQWLTQLPLALEVSAFGSAPRERGGDGALLLLLG